MTKYTGHGLLTAFTDVGNSYAVFVENSESQEIQSEN